jgi:hypothetical protein
MVWPAGRASDRAGWVVHGGIVLAVTWLLSLPYSEGWWPYALLIGLTHTLIDLVRTRVGRGASRSAVLGLFLLDQALHLTIILVTLSLSGDLALDQIVEAVARWSQDARLVTFIIGYTFITKPAWIIVSFLVRGLVTGTETEALLSTDKYIGILERGLITTLVIVGQFSLIPLVAVPRLIFDGPRVRNSGMTSSYMAELLASAAMAIAVGLALRQV